jgi:hypothetical protein
VAQHALEKAGQSRCGAQVQGGLVPQQEITMNVLLPLRHRKFWAVMLAISVLTTLFTHSYFGFLKEWLPLVALFILMNLITPVNKLQSLSPIYKALIGALGLAMIVWGSVDLNRIVSLLVHPFF